MKKPNSTVVTALVKDAIEQHVPNSKELLKKQPSVFCAGVPWRRDRGRRNKAGGGLTEMSKLTSMQIRATIERLEVTIRQSDADVSERTHFFRTECPLVHEAQKGGVTRVSTG